jgi:hypothetical protein
MREKPVRNNDVFLKRGHSPEILFEAAQLAAMDLDAMGVAVLGNFTLVNLELCGDGESLRAGDPLLNSFGPECLFDLVSVHDY